MFHSTSVDNSHFFLDALAFIVFFGCTGIHHLHWQFSMYHELAALVFSRVVLGFDSDFVVLLRLW